MIRSILLCAALLAGCATPLRAPQGVVRSQIDQFAVSARFSLRLENPGEIAQQWSGRLQWQHAANNDRLLFADPLGQGVAELDSQPGSARLRLASGETHSAPDAEKLLAGRLGYALPLRQLPNWLLGRAGSNGQIDLDTQGRPLRLLEDGWRVDYAYDDEVPNSLPARLTVRRESTLELRLRIEEWQ